MTLVHSLTNSCDWYVGIGLGQELLSRSRVLEFPNTSAVFKSTAREHGLVEAFKFPVGRLDMPLTDSLWS